MDQEIEFKDKIGNDPNTTRETNLLNVQAYSLFMQAPVGFFLVKGEEHNVLLANYAALNLTGRTKNIIGKTITEVFPEIDVQGHLQLLNKVKNDKETIFLNESKVEVLKDGIRETLFINVVYQPYYEAKETVGVLAILTNVTEQVIARKKLENAEQKARIAIESAELGVYEINLISHEVNADNRFFQLFGFEKPTEWSKLTSLIPPEDLLIRDAAYNEANITGKLFYITRINSPDKSTRWLKINGSIFFNQERKPIKLLGVVEDITKQKLLDQQKDAFLSMASHELKTPVTTMKAYGQIAEVILEQKGDVQTLGMIKKMSSQVNKLTKIITDLLDVTKIQQDKLVLKVELFNFKDLIVEVLEDLKKIYTEHVIQIDLECTELVQADKDKIAQVLTNLISNAIKYAPNSKKIFIKTKTDKKQIIFSVQDFGIGIAKEEQDNIFQQFYRVTGDNQSTFPGMGIGLYICSEIIRRHNGNIWLESESGKGSTFFISLPIAKKD